LTLNGGGSSNPFIDSFTTANGGNYATTNTPTGGDIGANGGISLNGYAQIGGAVGVQSILTSPPAAPNPCIGPQGDYSVNGGNAGLYQPGTYPGNVLQTIPAYTFPTPPDPIPAPPSTPYAGGSSLVPGTYGAISTNGTLTLAPGTYNIYSLTMAGQGQIVVNPPGAVVLNFPSASLTPISFHGQGILASSNTANNVLINYGGTGTITLGGNASSYMNVDAPNATVSVSGNGDIYGRLIGNTLSWVGNGKFHFDKNSSLAPQSNGVYGVISFREVTY
jgi:hypothetical protein